MTTLDEVGPTVRAWCEREMADAHRLMEADVEEQRKWQALGALAVLRRLHDLTYRFKHMKAQLPARARARAKETP